LFQPKTLEQRSLVQPNLNAWKTLASTFWVFCGGWLIFWPLCPMMDKSYKEYRLPFLAWYPYNTQTSPQYEFTYLHQFVSINCISLVNVNIDTLIAGLNMYIGAQFDILCDDIRHLHDGSKDSLAEARQKLKECVKHHREILKFAEYANNFYNWPVFLQIFVGGICIGFSLFQMTVVVPFSAEFYSFLTYSFAIIVQVFMYCWFGNEIEVKSSKLSYAAFESDWTNLSPEVKKILIIFTLNVQKPLKVSAFGLFYLSLETFMKILRTAWSYFTLLRQVNLRKQ
ncbi:7tm 6 and/or DUF2225 domain containing protein, partial [Asbolus verrucosus]